MPPQPKTPSSNVAGFWQRLEFDLKRASTQARQSHTPRSATFLGYGFVLLCASSKSECCIYLRYFSYPSVPTTHRRPARPKTAHYQPTRGAQEKFARAREPSSRLVSKAQSAASPQEGQGKNALAPKHSMLSTSYCCCCVMVLAILNVAAGALPINMRRALLLRPSSLATAAFASTTTTTTTTLTTRRRRLLRRRAINPEAPMAGTVKLYNRHVRVGIFPFLAFWAFIRFPLHHLHRCLS